MTIAVRENNGRCLLRFTHKSIRYSLTLGDYTNKADYLKAQRISLEIQESIDNDTFNGIEKWKAQKNTINKLSIIKELSSLEDQLSGAIIHHLSNYEKEIRTPKEAQKFIESLNVSTATKRRYYTAIRRIPELKEVFNFPIKSQKGEVKQEIDPFTTKEVEKIKKAMDGWKYETFTLFLLYTGCRISEAIGIRESDIDTTAKRVRFSEALARNQSNRGKRVRKSTKTGKARYTPLSNELNQIMGERLILMWEEIPDGGLVFINPDGSPYCDDNYRKAWQKLLQKAGVRYRRPYNLRHTFISHCLRSGVDVVTVASWVGNSAEVIYKHYAGLVEETKMPELYS